MTSYKALVMVSPGQDLEVQTRDLQAAVDRLPAEGVLVRVRAAGVCHTDLHVRQGGYRTGKDSWLSFADRPGYGYPLVPGHEIAGSVHAFGSRPPAPSTLSVGDRVAVYTFAGCDECEVCRGGDPHLCANSKQQLGFSADGGYAEYVAVPHWKYAIKLPASVSYQQGCLVSCGGLTAYCAIRKAQPVVDKVQQWNVELFVAVIGLGGLGQWALMLLRQCLPNTQMKVVGVDINEVKLKLAQERNLVDDIFMFDNDDTAETATSKFGEKFSGKKLHVVFDFVNSEQTCLFSLSSLNAGGTLMCIGMHGGSLELALPLLPLKAHTISGVHGGSLRDMQELNELMGQGNMQSLIMEYQFLDANKALLDLKNGRISGRGVLIL